MSDDPHLFREFWIVIHDGTAWDTKEQADEWAAKHESVVYHVRTIDYY